MDEATELPNLRGFAAIAEHYVRMADRLGQPVVFVFVRLEDSRPDRCARRARRRRRRSPATPPR